MAEEAVKIILLDAVTSTGAGEWQRFKANFMNANATFQASANGSAGAFSATIDIEVSNDGVNALDTPMGTITLSGTATTVNSCGFASNASWLYVRGNVTAISGTGANVTLIMGA